MRSLVFLWFLVPGITWIGVRASLHAACAKDNLDIFIVLDGSRSIHEGNFERLRKFLTNLVGQFNVGKFESRIGLMQFSNRYRTVIEFNFGEHETIHAIQENIKNLIHHNGSTTYTGKALKTVNEKIFTGKNKDREDAEKVLLLVTDGHSHDTRTALREADKLKHDKGVHLITVGVGSNKWIGKFKYELSRLGSKPTHNKRVDYQDLQKITQSLVQNICNSKERQPAPPHKCFQEKQDVLILIDGSTSVGKRNFLKVKRFLQDFLSRLDIGPSRVHAGVIQFSDSFRSHIEISLGQYLTVHDLMAAVSKLVYQGGLEADLATALRLVDVALSGRTGDRISAPDTIIIFTDGNYKHKTEVQAILASVRKRQIRVVTVAVGKTRKTFNEQNVNALALHKDDVLDVNTLDPSQFLDNIAPTSCKITTCTTAAPKCLPESQDIIILIDGASKIGKRHFDNARRYIKRLVGKMTLGKNQTHVGVIQYGGTRDVTHHARLGQHILRSDVGSRIARMEFKGSNQNSDLAYALSAAEELLFINNDPERDQVSKTLVIITDGDMADFVEANHKAETLRNQGVRIITLSNGMFKAKAQFISSLRLIASGPKEHYSLENSQFNEVLTELQKTVCISEAEIPKTCFTQKRNIFFAIDSSTGRGRKKFKEMKEFMESLISKFHLGSPQTNVGFVQYDGPTSTEDAVVFNKSDTAPQILWRIQNMKYRKGKGSFLGVALKAINKKVFVQDYDYDYKNVLIIIGHKEISDKQLAFDEAEKLKNKGVQIISIATGGRKRIERVKSQLQVISNSPTNAHTADYHSLWTIVDEVLVNICGLGKCPAFMTTTCLPTKQDVVFVVDGSRSIGIGNFIRLQRFTGRLASRLDLAKDRTHLGLLQTGDKGNSKFQFNLGEFPDRDDILYMTKDMEYLASGTTYMGAGLKEIREKVFNKGGPDRPDVPNTLVLFTDGWAHDSSVMFDEAEKLKAMGVKILSVGYGVNVTLHTFKDNLMKVATNAKDVFVIDFDENDLVLEEQIETIARDLVQVECPRGVAPPVECTQGAIDLFLLVDGSRSIGPYNFRIVKRFLKKLTSEFDVGDKSTHIGMFQFSDRESLTYEFGLNQMASNKAVKKGIKRVKYKAGGTTLTGEALQSINDNIFIGKYGDRPDIPDVLLIFTDGQAHDFPLALQQAKAMRRRGIKIIAVAAGEQAKNPKTQLVGQLNEIADEVFTADYNDLTNLVDNLIDINCVVRQRRVS